VKTDDIVLQSEDVLEKKDDQDWKTTKDPKQE
jgi:hypothetical protein